MTTTHNLPFEAAPWVPPTLIYLIGGKKFRDDTIAFRVGSCKGIYTTSKTAYQIIAVTKRGFKKQGKHMIKEIIQKENCKLKDMEATLAYHHKETPEQNPSEDYSYDVVIDLDGNRKNFRIGWYDFTEKEWRFHDHEAYRSLDLEHMKWMDILPHDKD